YYVPVDDLNYAAATIGIFNLVHAQSVVKIDIIVRKNQPYREAEFARRTRVELAGFPVWIVSKEDLILSKLYWAKDSRSELQLRDVRNLLATGADEQYLNQWANQLALADLLREITRA